MRHGASVLLLAREHQFRVNRLVKQYQDIARMMKKLGGKTGAAAMRLFSGAGMGLLEWALPGHARSRYVIRGLGKVGRQYSKRTCQWIAWFECKPAVKKIEFID